MRLTRTSRIGALALTAALTITGCGALSGPDRPDGAKTTAGAAPENAAPEGAAPDDPSDVGVIVATRDVEISRGGKAFSVRVELGQLRRRDGFVTVNVKLTRTDQDATSWQVGEAFQGDTISLTFAGVTLVDRKNRKRYLVARVNAGAGRTQANQAEREEYLASSDLSSVFVRPGQSIWLYATFGAPPDDVTAVDVVIPRVPVFENVPLG
ncbi:hypothetical protein AB0C02_10930 [Micromonospora sp. NPDC048999]|uniref:hypothetical protein n=1 Tax=Micromonospora sp. NPDC048999 TaxID=3155391 RepID=UPI0033FA0A37